MLPRIESEIGECGAFFLCPSFSFLPSFLRRRRQTLPFIFVSRFVCQDKKEYKYKQRVKLTPLPPHASNSTHHKIIKRWFEPLNQQQEERAELALGEGQRLQLLPKEAVLREQFRAVHNLKTSAASGNEPLLRCYRGGLIYDVKGSVRILFWKLHHKG